MPTILPLRPRERLSFDHLTTCPLVLMVSCIQNSGVLTKATSNTCFGGIGANCGQNPELLPDRWTATIPCAADTTGTGSQVLPGNVAIPLLTLGDGYEIKASDCIQRCTTLGHSFAAVENCTWLSNQNLE
jgi:hypothetical protein